MYRKAAQKELFLLKQQFLTTTLVINIPVCNYVQEDNMLPLNFQFLTFPPSLEFHYNFHDQPDLNL